MMAQLFSNIFISSIALALASVLLLSLWKGREILTIFSFLTWVAIFLVGQKAIEFGEKKFHRSITQIIKQATATELTGLVTFGHKDSDTIVSVAVTPDGQTAVTNTVSYFHVWDIKTGQERWGLPHTARATLSASGKLLLVHCEGCQASPNNAYQIYDTLSGTLLAVLEEPPFGTNIPLQYRLFSPDENTLLLGSENMEVVLYDLKSLENKSSAVPQEYATTLQPIHVPRDIPTNTFGLPASYSHMGFNADSQSIYVHAFDTLEKWSIEAGPRLLESRRFADTIKFKPSKFSHDGNKVFYCEDSGIRLAETYAAFPSEVKQLAASAKMAPGSYSVSAHCAISPDNQWLALGLSENSGAARFVYSINMWNADGTLALNDTVPKPVDAEIPQVNTMAFSPDSKILYVADEALHLHGYALGDSTAPTILAYDDINDFKNMYTSNVLLATSNRGVVLSYHGASKAVWIPRDKPVGQQ